MNKDVIKIGSEYRVIDVKNLCENMNKKDISFCPWSIGQNIVFTYNNFENKPIKITAKIEKTEYYMEKSITLP